jgi:rhodanese-related sulfurtransferase
MEQLLEFAGNHPFLVTALVVVSGALALNLATGGGKNNIGPQQATMMINHDDAVVVDVRPMADFTQGHIVNALNMPINGFAKEIGRLEKHKRKPLIVGCRSGNQSQLACRQLRKAGFEQVYNLRGGMMAWQSANLPMTKKR